MLKKKKNSCKENIKPIKKLTGYPSFNLTEEIKIPSLNSCQLKNLAKSIELKKNTPQGTPSNPFKKPISRKSLSKSVKPNNVNPPLRLKNIMRQFKEMKNIYENQKSKSKSPISCKSKSTHKFNQKKISYQTLRTNPNSECNLILKLQKTAKQLNQSVFFKEQDSLIPMVSTSQMSVQMLQNNILYTQHEQEINMNELRQFCSTNLLVEKRNSSVSKKEYSFIKKNMAALKIQRVWRRYKTRSLIKRYTSIQLQEVNLELLSQQDRHQHFSPKRQTYELDEQDHSSHSAKKILDPSTNFYESEQQNQKIRKISNLQEQIEINSNLSEAGDSSNQNLQKMVNEMKKKQLQKWNQIIAIIQQTKGGNSADIEQLFKKIAEKSQQNKIDLLHKAGQSVENKKIPKIIRTPFVEDRIKEFPNKQVESSLKSIQSSKQKALPSESDHSLHFMEYDAKKYIQYLDGDIFPEVDQLSNSQKRRGEEECKQTISKRKQQLLIQQLQQIIIPIKLGDSELYHSESSKQFDSAKKNRSKSRLGLKKSTSQKMLRKTLSNMCQSPLQLSGQQINLQLLTRQFLECSDPTEQNLDMVYSEVKLRAKLAELNQMKQQDQERIDFKADINAVMEYGQDDRNNDKFSSENALKRSNPAFQLHRKNQQILVQEETHQKTIKIKEVQMLIQSQDDSKEEEDQRAESVATLIMNSLILQVLKDIAKSNNLSSGFKNYSLAVRPRVKKVDAGKRRKKGFPTDKAEIQNFLEGIISYLLKQQPLVFKNLQISTGPSALQMLRYMHTSVNEEQMQIQEQDQSNVMVIPNRIFDKFWQIKQRSIVVQIPEHLEQTNAAVFKHNFEYLKSFNKIFYRSLFDTFNQCLDSQRNFGQTGKPFPWKKAPLFNHSRSQSSINESIKTSRKKMLDIAVTYCGLIIQKQDLASIDQNQEYVKQVQEDRLSRMLAGDLIQNESRWMLYDDEETQILIEITNIIETELLIEIIELLSDFN